ncbi:hypothetical protein Cgig2_007785 [Carnegiea gigantea]|uniref:Uncharacterized protein n=1 Tax=Carnegiea gigantea TaxID=171969 RepID=A0A9Q1QB41_9CARY|nr:hypothetical protein Cgig2_007785 [Carnegiea gigantea]
MSAINSPVIVVGASYGGVLAAWFRIKYPHIVIGAVALSAPMLFREGVSPKNDFCSIMSRDFQNVNTTCSDIIRQSWNVIDQIASRTERGFQSCVAIRSPFPQPNVDAVSGWDWQLCSEIVIQKTCAKNYSLLIPNEAIDDHREQKENCRKAYGPLARPGSLPTYYGLQDIIKSASQYSPTVSWILTPAWGN